MAPKDNTSADEPYYVSRSVSLSRQEVIDALSAAVLARAGTLARFGPPRLRSMAVDAQVTDGHADIAGVVAQVEAPINPSVLIAALQSAPGFPGREPNEEG